MPDTDQLSLPVLPLTNGVVFPHMIVTLRMETAEGKTALEAARNADGRLLLVPRVDGRTPRSAPWPRSPTPTRTATSSSPA
jgi:ATP-dependent Lon protease